MIRDCQDDSRLSRQYSRSDLRKARDNLPSELAEYSNCLEVIGAAIKRASAPTDSGGNPAAVPVPVEATPAPARPEPPSTTRSRTPPPSRPHAAKDQADLEALTNSGDDPPPIDVGGQTVKPGENGLFDLASASNELPTPLLLALIAMGLALLAGAFLALRSKVPALARVPLPSKIRLPRVGRPRFRR